MYEAGLDNQIYFCLEDFQDNKEGIVRNLGVFAFDANNAEYKVSAKAAYNVFKMLASLGSDMFLPKLNDEFCGVIPTRSKEGVIAVLIYNYIDPEIGLNFLSRNIATLNKAQRRFALGLVKSDRFKKVMQGELDIARLRTGKKLKTLLKKAKELSDRARTLETTARPLKIGIKNLQEDYLYERYTVDSSCSHNCEFKAVEQKEVVPAEKSYQETLYLDPYSVNLIVLRKKPKEEPIPKEEIAEEAPAQPLESKADEIPVPVVVQNATNATN
jgi:hypothetical protein